MTGLNNDISAILETEGFAVRQYSGVKVEPKILEMLRESMLSFKKICFDYPIKDQIKRITLNPYGLVIADKYYLVVFNEYVQGLRQYKVDKIKNLEILDEYFDVDEKFNLKDWCNNSFGIYQEEPLEIVLEFEKCEFEYEFGKRDCYKGSDGGYYRVDHFGTSYVIEYAENEKVT